MPNLADVMFMAEILRQLGVSVYWRMGTAAGEGGGSMELHSPRRPQSFAPYDTVRKMRASFFVLGPLVARVREATVSLPGGCAIGARPVDLHLKGLQRWARRSSSRAAMCWRARSSGLKGAEYEFPVVSVGATENLLMAASLAKGRTVLKNAAREPEIGDLGRCLIAMGAKIDGLDTSTHRDRRREGAARGDARGAARPHRDGHLCDRGRDRGRRGGADRRARDLIGALIEKLRRDGRGDRGARRAG